MKLITEGDISVSDENGLVSLPVTSDAHPVVTAFVDDSVTASKVELDHHYQANAAAGG